MLVKPTMEKLLQKVSSRYVLTILAAKRARQLVDGAQPLAESDTPNYVTTACEEISAGKVVAVKGIHTVTVPLRPEVEAERLREEMEKRNARYREEMEEESNARMRSLMAIGNNDDETGDDDPEDKADDREEDQGVLDDLITFLDDDGAETADADDMFSDDITGNDGKDSSNGN